VNVTAAAANDRPAAEAAPPEEGAVGPYDFARVLTDELNQVAQRRAWGGPAEPPPGGGAGGPMHAAWKAVLDMELTCLAFSGGGIRSATFNLGILQGLARLKLLRRFEYLSTALRLKYGNSSPWDRGQNGATYRRRLATPQPRGADRRAGVRAAEVGHQTSRVGDGVRFAPRGGTRTGAQFRSFLLRCVEGVLTLLIDPSYRPSSCDVGRASAYSAANLSRRSATAVDD
jgi:hypothetical protein